MANPAFQFREIRPRDLAGPGGLCPNDDASDHTGSEIADHGFNFGKLGHHVLQAQKWATVKAADVSLYQAVWPNN
jgi:hypothetical protein